MSTIIYEAELVEMPSQQPQAAPTEAERVVSEWMAWLGAVTPRATVAALVNEVALLLPTYGEQSVKLALVSISSKAKTTAFGSGPSATAFAFSSAVMRLTSSKAGVKAERARLMADAAAHAAHAA